MSPHDLRCLTHLPEIIRNPTRAVPRMTGPFGPFLGLDDLNVQRLRSRPHRQVVEAIQQDDEVRPVLFDVKPECSNFLHGLPRARRENVDPCREIGCLEATTQQM